MAGKKAEDKSAKVLALVSAAIDAGMCCPTNEEIRAAVGHLRFEDALPQLAVAGHCIVEVYGRNWRVVEINGRRTMEPPHGGRPYKVFRPVVR